MIFFIILNNFYHQRARILDKIHRARNSTYKILEIHRGFDEIAKSVVNIFMEETKNFQNNSCLNVNEDSIPDIYHHSNCYSKLSIAIMEQIKEISPNIYVVVGETSSYSNYNSGGTYITIELGPIFFIVFFF